MQIDNIREDLDRFLYNRWEDQKKNLSDPEILKCEEAFKELLKEIPKDLLFKTEETVRDLVSAYCKTSWLDGFETMIILHEIL